MSRVTVMVEKLAAQYRLDGYDYPMAAAAAVACRGLTGLEQPLFADRAGLAVAEVSSFELGQRSASELVAAYRTVALTDVFELLEPEISS